MTADADEPTSGPSPEHHSDPQHEAGLEPTPATTPEPAPASDGLAIALGLVGQRWALLIVRELLGGPRRFGDLQRALPGIPTNILTTRLKEFQHTGLAIRVPLAHNALAYRLTERGESLRDTIDALNAWGNEHRVTTAF